jgi:YHS domain-containing protein
MAKLSKKLLSKFGFRIENKGNEVDLVCGMEVDASNSNFKIKHKGKEYFFCSENCLEHFKNDPNKYAG